MYDGDANFIKSLNVLRLYLKKLAEFSLLLIDCVEMLIENKICLDYGLPLTESHITIIFALSHIFIRNCHTMSTISMD